MSETGYILEMLGISKSFPGVRALDNVDLKLRSGEILSILGENGAGKSTLLKILAGVYQKDSGTIFIDGIEKELNSPLDSIKEGISVIYQELSYVDDLTVAENIFLNRYPLTKLKKVDWEKLNHKAQEVLESIGINIDPQLMMSELNVAEKQMVEIARAISRDMKILVTDEPTSAITEHEVEALFTVFEKLKHKNVSIIFISHKLKEVMEISDEVLVLRDGKEQGLYRASEISERELISHMIGRSLKDLYPERKHTIGDVVLEAKELVTQNISVPITFELHAGEILGIFGLMGSGIIEIGEALFGIRTLLSGVVNIHGKSIKAKAPQHLIKNGIAYIPAERKQNGMIGSMSVSENMAIPDLVLNNNLLVDHEKDNKRALYWRDQFSIKTPQISTPIVSLSGGNQQKVILSKWLDGNPKIIILNEPTRGIDMGAKAEIYKFIENFCREGGAVILISSELPEVIALSDKYLILHDRVIQEKVFSAGEIEEKEIMALAMGL